MRQSPLPKASDLVVAEFRRRILEEGLPVGSRLPSELELAEEFELGRVTIREALRILERDGLVRTKRGPSGGSFVRHPDVDQVSQAVAMLLRIKGPTLGDFAEYRLELEPKIAELAAINATDEEKAHLVKVADKNVTVESTADFHDELSSICGNEFFHLAQKSMHVALSLHFRKDHIADVHQEDTHRAHSKIAERIAAGDPEGASRAMLTHLNGYRAFIHASGLENEPVLPNSLALPAL